MLLFLGVVLVPAQPQYLALPRVRQELIRIQDRNHAQFARQESSLVRLDQALVPCVLQANIRQRKPPPVCL